MGLMLMSKMSVDSVDLGSESFLCTEKMPFRKSDQLSSD